MADYDRKATDRRPITATLQTRSASGALLPYDLTGATTIEAEVYSAPKGAAVGAPAYYLGAVSGTAPNGGVTWTPSVAFAANAARYVLVWVVDRGLATQASFPEDETVATLEFHPRTGGSAP